MSLRQAAPEITLKDHQGKTRTLSEWTGKPVLLHFWASWCPPCLEEIPRLIAFAKKNPEKVAVVAVSLDEKWEDAEKILSSESLPGNMVSLLDSETKVSEAYGSYEYPETYLVSSAGKIITKWIGPQKWDSEYFEKLLDHFHSQKDS